MSIVAFVKGSSITIAPPPPQPGPRSPFVLVPSVYSPRAGRGGRPKFYCLLSMLCLVATGGRRAQTVSASSIPVGPLRAARPFVCVHLLTCYCKEEKRKRRKIIEISAAGGMRLPVSRPPPTLSGCIDLPCLSLPPQIATRRTRARPHAHSLLLRTAAAKSCCSHY